LCRSLGSRGWRAIELVVIALLGIASAAVLTGSAL
jgi:hypothetical protein